MLFWLSIILYTQPKPRTGNWIQPGQPELAAIRQSINKARFTQPDSDCVKRALCLFKPVLV